MRVEDRITERQAALTLRRLRPRLETRFAAERKADPAGWDAWAARLDAHFGKLFGNLLPLYAGRYDFFYRLELLLAMAARSWFDRPAALRELDAAREADPGWFHAEGMMGGVVYVDLFAGELAGVRAQIPYFRELGLTYLHLMPLFRAPEGNNDGGYAVSSYREVEPGLGTMAELAAVAGELRRNGISLVLDFVFNHTSDEHAWARAAATDPEGEDADGNPHGEYYWLFPDRTLPDAYQRTLREIFPDQRPGSFTFRSEIPPAGRWVWTTFNSFQWDLNYLNPVVFERMAAEMLFLANRGAEVLRLDAVAFVWKRLGTPCESLPEAHLVVRAFNALARIAAPVLLFKSEAIVHPDEVASYIAPEECQLSYNPLLMALLWEALATRDARLLRESLRDRVRIDPRCAWVNYVRSHDDLGWTFDDRDAERLGIDPFGHRRFLNAFYTGRFPGSFARGLPFQENPRTGDARVSGTAASLAGLEKALREEGEPEVELAIGRILLLYGVVLAVGGIPLLYLGDELATVNDYRFAADPARADDSRWVHRPATDWPRAERRHDPTTVEGRVFAGLRRLIERRKETPALAGGETEVVDPGNDGVFAFVRRGGGGGGDGGRRVVVVANVTDQAQTVGANALRVHGLAHRFTDLVTGETIGTEADLTLAPYRLAWLAAG